MSKAPGVDDRGAVRLRLNVQAIRDEIGRIVRALTAGAAALGPDVVQTYDTGDDPTAAAAGVLDLSTAGALDMGVAVVPAADVLAMLAAVDLALARLQAHDHA